MPITQLSITDFRNHRALRLEPGEGFVLLSGPNGAGKTNILEAVSLLVPGRGLRRARYQDMARDGGPGGFTVFAGLGELEIGTGTSPDAPARRQVRINGASASAGDLAEWLSVVWLTPAMDRLFTESASGRRRFLDRLVLALHPGHAAHAARYELAMRERNRLLSDDRPADPDWLDAIELRMAEHGAALAQARDDLIARLGEALETEPEGAFARPAIALDRKGEAEPDAMTRQWRGGRAIDRAAGRTLAGPHRTDLVVHHAAKDRPAAHCSTGEQKAMLLALILSHSELVAASTGQRPILLLDEVAAHLDPVRRATLFDRLGARAGQVWMTGTEEGLFDGIGAHASRFAIGGHSTTSPDEQG